MISQDAFTSGRGLLGTILSKMTGIGKVQHRFLSHILILFLSMRGKINFLQMGRYGQMDEHSYRYQFGNTFDWIEFNQQFIEDQCSNEVILGFDPSFISKSGKHTYGLGYFYNGCQGKVDRGLEIGCFSAIDIKQNTAYHVLASQTEYTKSKDQLSNMKQYCEMIEKHSKELHKISSIIAVDAWFYKKEYVQTCLNFNFELITRMRDDANLQYLYNAEQKGGKGRPKKYAGKIDLKNIDKRRFKLLFETLTERVYESIVYSVLLGFNIKAVYIESIDDKGKHISHKIFMSTNLQRDGLQILKYYKARYQMEFNFRDGKQYTGLSDCQARDKEKLNYHFNASLSSLNIAKTIARNGIDKEQPIHISIHDVMTELSNKLMLDLFFSNFEINPHLIKNKELIAKFLNFGKKAA
jgi:hypothetical protein